MKWKKTRMVASVLAAALVITCYRPVFADKTTDAEEKKQQAEAGLDEVNQQIENIQSAQNSLQAEMNRYDDQMMTLLTDMEILENDMVTQELEIAQANADLEVAQMEERQQYNNMKLRIQYMYENGNQSIWTAVVGADSITDFLNRVEYVSDVYEYDRQMLLAYQDVVQQVEDLRIQLEAEMAEMEELNLNYQEQQSSLQQIIAAKQAEMADFDSQLVNAQSLASQYAKTIRQQNKIIADEKKKREEEERAQAAAKDKNNQTTGNAGVTAGNGGNMATGGGTGNGGSTGSSGTGGGSGLTDGGLNPPKVTGVNGNDVVAYASQFLGCPYVLGGTSLTNGADCSYFVMAVYQNFGISVPRTSYAQRNCGQAVSYENAQPGDIICYPGHVAIYIGGGRIIHASNPRTGICYGSATYRTITGVRRVL